LAEEEGGGGNQWYWKGKGKITRERADICHLYLGGRKKGTEGSTTEEKSDAKKRGKEGGII